MSEQKTTSERPKRLAVALNELSRAVITQVTPAWFSPSNETWAAILKEAADVAEQYDIQNDSYSRLCKQVYG